MTSLVPKPRCVHGEPWDACRFCTRYEYRKVMGSHPFGPLDAPIRVETVAIPGDSFPMAVTYALGATLRCVKPSCGRPYKEHPGACFDCGSDVYPVNR